MKLQIFCEEVRAFRERGSVLEREKGVGRRMNFIFFILFLRDNNRETLLFCILYIYIIIRVHNLVFSKGFKLRIQTLELADIFYPSP